jgi:lipopolysaccharide transport system ATP-binding protein
MSDQAHRIIFDGVSKRYLWRRDRARSFLDVFSGLMRGREPAHEFWALRELSLTVKPGEAVALIGPNGAGKSTALKLASRVIEPTKGTVAVSGRVSALLELAAGFHPDLSGRENVFLSGALMGLSRRAIQDRFDEIVEFSGVSEFIDSPVRHYSSGMAMRLGFAVASSIEPEVLLIDEVLAVGDRAFSQRCLDRIFGLKERGTAILFVSHDLEAVRSLCERAVLLDRGQAVLEGPTDQVISRYLRRASQFEGKDVRQEREERWGSGEVSIVEVWLENDQGERVSGVDAGAPFAIGMRYRVQDEVEAPVFGLGLRDQSGYLLTGPNTRFDGVTVPLDSREGELRYYVPYSPLQAGRYFAAASIYDQRLVHAYDHWEYCLAFDVYPAEQARCFGVLSLAGQWLTSEPAVPVDGKGLRP